MSESLTFETLDIGTEFRWRGDIWRKTGPHHAVLANALSVTEEEFVPNAEQVTPKTDQ